MEPSTEHLDVLVVGAGLSGIGAGHFLQTGCPWASYAVFEARDAIGGTWDLFRYPGIRSDSDMFTLGYSFRPWTGEKAIADGDSILRYVRETAAEEGIDRHIRFHHRVVAADWSTEDAHWRVTAERTDTGERLGLTCDFLVSCTGYYRYDHGYRPDFPGEERFTGPVIHPQAWPDDLDYAGQRVLVIGSGATAVTLVPSMAVDAAHVTMVQRSPTYVMTLPARDPVAQLLRRVLGDQRAGAPLRWLKALLTQGMYVLSRRRPALMRRILRRQVERQLPAGYDIDTHFTPRYDPWDQRLCVVPDGDLFERIRDGSVDVVTDTIETFTEHGVRLTSGTELEADLIVTATGLDLLFLGGIAVTVDGEPVDPATKLSYKGMMLQDVPNLAVVIGYTNASWTLKADLTCDYVARLLNRLRATGLRQATPVDRTGTVAAQPLLGLNSGYVLRAADRMPRQGTEFPWRVHQSYLRDYRALKLSGLDDDAMVLSNPVRRKAMALASEGGAEQ
jgi:cation diffusion facilitator CzcD-associated flavoprotein CzcO